MTIHEILRRFRSAKDPREETILRMRIEKLSKRRKWTLNSPSQLREAYAHCCELIVQFANNEESHQYQKASRLVNYVDIAMAKEKSLAKTLIFHGETLEAMIREVETSTNLFAYKRNHSEVVIRPPLESSTNQDIAM